MDFLDPTKPGPGVNEPPPEKGILLFFFVLKNHFVKIVALNLLFILFSLPVITIPAALCAVNRVIIIVMRDGGCHLFSDFWKEFKGSFWRGLLIGVLYAAAMVLLYMCALYYPVLVGSKTVGIIMFAVSLALMLFFTVVITYAFVMCAWFNLKVFAIIKNSLLIAVISPLQSLIMLVAPIGLNVLMILLFPKSIPLIITITIGLAQLIACVCAKTPFEKHLVKQ